jgi:MoxR-like ATPase
MTSLNRFLEAMKKTNLIPFILGRHGIGKTQRVAAYAKEFGYELIVIEGTVLKEGELTGLPLNIKTKVEKEILSLEKLLINVNNTFGDPNAKEIEVDGSMLLTSALVQLNKTLVQEEDEDGIVLTYSKYLQFRKAEQMLEEGKKVVIFIDEANRVPSEVSTELMNFCQSKKINTVDFAKYGKNVYIILAGNPAYDKDYNYNVTEFNEAFKDRLAPIELSPNFEEWMDWAIGKIDSRILQFLNNHKNLLHSWAPDEALRGVTNRSWSDLNDLIKDVDSDTLQDFYAPMIHATIGLSVGSLFIASLKDLVPLFPEKFLENKYSSSNNKFYLLFDVVA